MVVFFRSNPYENQLYEMNGKICPNMKLSPILTPIHSPAQLTT